MPNRSELITRYPLVEAGQRMPKEAMQKREAEMLKGLHDDVPALAFLRASVVITDYEATSTGLKLVVLLRESEQAPLPFPAVGAGRRSGTSDPFLEDVADVRDQAGAAEGHMLIAASGAASPLDGSKDSPKSSSTASIRKRLRRSLAGHGVFAPQAPDALPLSIEQPPTTLPQGPRIEITARVHSLSHEAAQLNSVRLADARGASINFKFAPATQLTLGRVGVFQQVGAGTKLQIAMDTGVRLKLEVIAALDWASGEVREFELKNFA
jgi:hypothetical protein